VKTKKPFIKVNINSNNKHNNAKT